MTTAEATLVAAVDRPRVHQAIDHELRIETGIGIVLVIRRPRPIPRKMNRAVSLAEHRPATAPTIQRHRPEESAAAKSLGKFAGARNRFEALWTLLARLTRTAELRGRRHAKTRPRSPSARSDRGQE